MRFILAIISLSITLCAFETIPGGYKNIRWGFTAENVNEALMATNLIKSKLQVERVEVFQNQYPDPNIVWYMFWPSANSYQWIHLNFTPAMSNLVHSDSKIRYLPQIASEDYSVMTARGDTLVNPNSWVYRFYFYNKKLFAVMLRYESEKQIQKFYERNPEKKNIHPGYIIPEYILKENIAEIGRTYGGPSHSVSKQFDRYCEQHYAEYYRKANDTMITTYYQSYYGNFINFTVNYLDNNAMVHTYTRLQQNRYFYDETGDTMDIIKF